MTNLQDHLEVYIQYKSLQPVSMQPAATQKWRRPFIGAEWLFLRSGPGASNHFEGGGFARSNEDVAYPNLMFHFLPLAIRYDGSAGAAGHGYQVHVGPMYSDARGSVSLKTTDPHDHPALRFNYLSTDQDRREWVEAIRVARHILNQPAMDPYNGGETSPGPVVTTDDEIRDWVARDAETALHPSCTARMGTDERVRAGPADDARPRARRAARRGCVGDAVRHQRQHLRPGDDAGREGRRPDPRQHAAACRAHAVLPASAAGVQRCRRDRRPIRGPPAGQSGRLRARPRAEPAGSGPRRSHANWTPAPDRPDIVDTLAASNEGRIPELVPIRTGRMLASPFAFLRGSAAVMAGDLAATPVIGSKVQLCGDAHLANFGVFASPERRLVFDLNDFDETYRGPWEWDLKRLAASVVVASRENGFPEATNLDMGRIVAWQYRRWIRRYAGMRALQVWYAAIPIESIIERVERARDVVGGRPGLEISMAEARRKDHMAALGKLSTTAPGGGWLIRDRPPLLQRLPTTTRAGPALAYLRDGYLRSLAPDRRLLVEKHHLVDVALKVVGVGSVGTRCYIALFAGPAGGPLVLQVKEARASVLAPYIRGGRWRHQGERVVTGQRIMQAVSDSFLGWTKSPVTGTEYYVRQLHDMKYGVDIAGLRAPGMRLYAEVCAWALARAHARSGNPAEIAGYLGPGDVFDRAIASFAVAYADQTERDHAALVRAVRAGRLPAETGI